jgi:hypothetical protein
LRHLRDPGGQSDPRKRPLAASQLIWRDQAGDRADTTLVQRALWKRSVPPRYFNTAGAASEGEIGELHEPETRLVPLEPTIRRRMEWRSTTTFTLRIWPRLIRALERLCFGRGSTAPRSNLGTAGSFGTRVDCRG